MEKLKPTKDKPETTQESYTEQADVETEHQRSEPLCSENTDMSALFEEEFCLQDDSKDIEKKLEIIIEQIKELFNKVDSLQQSSDKNHSLQQVIFNLGKECSELRELHYERELIIPLACLVIGIADRCRKQIRELGEMVNKNETANNNSALKALHYIARSRKADLAEIEGVIASLGIEIYESPESCFNPELHTCLQRIKSDQPEQHLQIAARILPGYRRYERIVRKEIVNLYVNHTHSD